MVVKERYEGLQTLALSLHKDGCHFLTLCSIADEYRYDNGLEFIDLITAIRLCQSKGLIDDEFYVKDDGCKVLKLLTAGKKWTRKDVETLPPIGDNDYTEAIYFNPRTQFHHYRRRYFDTLDHSVTVEEGYVESYRIYTVHG
jgi:hypothetical protein